MEEEVVFCGGAVSKRSKVRGESRREDFLGENLEKKKSRWRLGNRATNLGHHSDHAASLVVREVSKLSVNVRPWQGCSKTTLSWKDGTPGCNRVGHGPVVAGVLVLVHHPLSLLHVEPFPRVDLRVDVVRGDVGDVLGEALIEPHLVPPEYIHLA